MFGPSKGKGGDIGGKTDEQLVRDLINIHNAENWLGIDGDSDGLSMFNKSIGSDLEDSLSGTNKGMRSSWVEVTFIFIFHLLFRHAGNPLSDDDSESVSREASPCSESPRPVSVGSESPNENICTMPNHQMNNNNNNNKHTNTVGTNSSSGCSMVGKAYGSSNVVGIQQSLGRMTREQKVGVSKDVCVSDSKFAPDDK